MRICPVLIMLTTAALGCTQADHRAEGSGTSELATCGELAGETIRWIVPYTPGGGYDVYSRLLEPYYEAALGAEIVIENRLGAGGRVGARLVRDADPDGRTLGLTNGTGMAVQHLLGQADGLHPLNDFTPIGRISSQIPVLFTAAEGPYPTVERLIAGDPDGPLVHGIVEVGSTSWILYVAAAELLALDVTYVSGYPGTRESSLGMLRGEFDLAGYTFDSMRDRTGAGGLRPVVQLSERSRDEEPELRDVPVIEGSEGLAVRRARELGRDPQQAAVLAAAITDVFAIGRLVVAPPGMPVALTQCLRNRLESVARDSAFLANAARIKRKIAFLDVDTLTARFEATAAAREEASAVFLRYIDEARTGSAGR